MQETREKVNGLKEGYIKLNGQGFKDNLDMECTNF